MSAIALVVKGHHFDPSGDHAVNELRTRDVGHHAVLIGPYSRDAWNHLGPAYYYLLALPYRLSGSASIAMFIGALLINGAAIVGIIVIAGRIGGTRLWLLSALGCAVVTAALGPAFVRDPWNPYLPVLPFGLLVMLCWATVCGARWTLPIAVGVASFVVQTHIAYALLVPPLVVGATAVFAVGAVRTPARDRRDRFVQFGRPLAVALLVLVVMWLPPVIEQVTHSPGNITKVIHYFRHSTARTHTLREGVRLVFAQFSWSPEWLTGPGKIGFAGEPRILHVSARAPVLLVPFALACVVFWRRRMTNALWFAGTVAAAFAVGIIAVERTIGTAFAYRLRFALVLGMFAGVLIAWAVWTIAIARSPKLWNRALVATTIAALVGFATVNGVAAVRLGQPQATTSKVIRHLLPQVTSALPDRRGAVIVRSTSFSALIYQSGIMLGLERRGDRAMVDSNVARFSYGDARLYRGGPTRAVLTIVTDEDVDAPSGPNVGRLVAYWGDKNRVAHQRLLQARLARVRQCSAEHLELHRCLIFVAAVDPGRAVAVFMTNGPGFLPP